MWLKLKYGVWEWDMIQTIQIQLKYTNQNKGKCRNLKVLTNSKGYVTAKWCNKCYQYLDVDSFEWDDSREGYLVGWCKDCSKVVKSNIRE